ncbi:MAG: GTP cyclohydrolase II [Myxococcales bacterium]|nr:GTP cyclohydrolase II [Myxococcales bacterium]MCB9671641.1 GTP cyclohydrolase II [Alphaproteobacteria bacterium]MCB9693140.1 GTP cyclohydrolase II [Alphaproteobacteria bacterium]
MNDVETMARQETHRMARLVAEARLPTRYGDFRVVAFDADDGKEYGAVVKGDVAGREDVPVRLHSECFTGDVMGSVKCDCRDQLEAALEYLGQAECGAVIYLRQEGRGIGLANKIRAYALQDAGLDTVEANLALGFRDDERRYDVAADILAELDVRSVKVLTNNPNKLAGLTRHGIRVTGRIPLQVDTRPQNVHYLSTKASKSGHMLIDLPGLKKP